MQARRHGVYVTLLTKAPVTLLIQSLNVGEYRLSRSRATAGV